MDEMIVEKVYKEIDKVVRCRLLECLQHRAEIDQWLSGLTDGERFRINHPDTVLKRWKGSTTVPDPNAVPKPPSAFAKLKETNVDLQERLHRAERELAAGGGDLWKNTDTAADIARVMVRVLQPGKAERTAREILKQLKERKSSTSPSVEAGCALKGSASTRTGSDRRRPYHG